MDSKKINQLATNVAPSVYDLTVIGDATTGQLKKITLNQIASLFGSVGGVSSVAMTVPTGLSISGSPITTSGTLAVTLTSGYSIPTTAKQAEWDLGYSERMKWDGGSVGLDAPTARTSLGLVIGTNVLAYRTFGTAASNNTGDFATAAQGVSADTAYSLRLTGASLPLSISGNNISITQSSTSANGYLSSTDWNTFNGKESAITAGTTSQYWRGDKTWQTLNTTAVPEGTNLYFTNAKAIASTLTGYTSGAGVVSATDTILGAIQKLNGNIGALTVGVSSVFGRTGAVVATEGDYTLTQLYDVTITSPTTGQVLKYNGTTWVNDTDANTGTVTSIGLSAPTGFSVSSSPITTNGTIALSFTSGYSLPTNAKQTEWDSAYTNRITSLTTTGTSGVSTLSGNTLNIPDYGSALSGYLPLTGGILTGALSGTSASFSSTITATDFRYTNNGYLTYDVAATGTNTMQIRSGYAGAVLSFTGLGAATFSSSIQATGAEIISTTGGILRLKRDDGTVTTDESLGTLEFYTNDGDGPHIGAYVRGLGADLAGQNYGRFGALSFGVSKTANTDAVEAMRIDLNGQLGINTTTPIATLDVNGTGRFSSSVTSFNSGGTYFSAENGAGGYAKLEISSNATSNATLSFTNQLALTGGNVLIGTTTDAGYKLDVNGTGRFSGAAFGVNLVLDSYSGGANASFRSVGTEYGTIGSELGYYGSGSATNLSLAANTSRSLILGAGGSRILTLASTGAATFSNNILVNDSFGLVNVSSTSTGFFPTSSLTLLLKSNGSTALTIDSSLAATFSSSVSFINESVIDGNNWFLKTTASNTDLAINYNGKTTASLIFYSGTTEKFKVTSTGAATFGSTIKTAAPTGGTADVWKLGTVVSGTCVPANFGDFAAWFTGNVIEIEINGSTYYVPAVIQNYC